MITTAEVLRQLRPMHVCVDATGHIVQSGPTLEKLAGGISLRGARFLECFEVLRPSRPNDVIALRRLAGRMLKLRLRAVPAQHLKGLLIEDGAGGAILDLSLGISVVDAVRAHGLTAQDFAPTDLAVELLFLQEAKSAAMDAALHLSSRLDDARVAAETRALTDGLTGLRNRRALDEALARLAASKTPYSVLHLDLDRFKQVNDELGHPAGDAVLRRVARIMREETRKDDILVRSGGDEFVILCPGLTDRERLANLSQTLIDRISEAQSIGQDAAHVGASIGIAISKGGAQPGRPAPLDAADIALYVAKRAGRGCFRTWTPAMGARLPQNDVTAS